jgi:hypothetical protein
MLSQIYYIFIYHISRCPCFAESEHPEKYGWWLNELNSLSISTLQKDGINDNRREASVLSDAMKQTLYEEYLISYNEK